MNKFFVDESSFRDRNGFVFYYKNEVYRQINKSYKNEFDRYSSSGLHQELVDKGYIIPHDEVEIDDYQCEKMYKIIKPVNIPYISYPYEWCFSQLKDAALLTLNIQIIALKYGFTLKDATAYNIQFYKGKVIFIDTLSFELYQKGPWNAYNQFCKHFLAPLILKKNKDHRLGRLSELFIDGIPLDLASKLLPKHSWLNFHVFSHIHMHARFQSNYASKHDIGKIKIDEINNKLNINKISSLVESLKDFIHSLSWSKNKSEWGDYYNETNYDVDAMSNKIDIVEGYLLRTDIEIESIADLGANNGHFIRLANKYSNNIISFDIDELAVEKNYMIGRDSGKEKMLPLVLDLVNPSPSIGWANCERNSFKSRKKFDVVLALALIHHLAISNNVPLSKIISLFHEITNKFLIIEFVPKDDSQVDKLLKTRKDIFTDYSESCFEYEARKLFNIVDKVSVRNSKRVIYYLSPIND